ncbi:hypothetical protein [Rhodococcus tibetensis]|uniref:DUF2029 domain-containing protein n=1 Tax=Rhodococcus tibetensis TaxID=2965064 RepID=A0ABT1QES4_9NOCA|nr:hypothetical protein [Rhodococcus sp. FXJ9.536]MCQ4120789.1 hypothetical protein [Rhodococcus sp. FXJ9.536]
MDFREPLSAAAALSSGALAGFVLTNPRNRAWAIYASDREIDRWLSSQPTGVVVALVLAVIAVAALQRSGSRRASWVVGAACALVLIGTRSAVAGASGVDTLIVLHFAKTATAGILLGAAVAAVWGRWAPQLTLVLGVAGAFVLASVQRLPRGDTEYLEPASRSTSAIGEPPMWLLLGTLVLALVSAVVAQKQFRVQRPERRTLQTALATALALALLNRLLGAWIDDHEFGEPLTVWMIIALCLVVVLVCTEVSSRLLPGIDGHFLLAATAVTAAAMPVLDDLRTPRVTTPASAVLMVGVIALALGIVLAVRVPPSLRRPHWGLALAALVPLTTAIQPDLGDDGILLLVRLFVLCTGMGFALATALPASAPVAVLGLALPFASLVFVAATTIPGSRVVLEGPHEPLRAIGVLTRDADTPSSAPVASDHLAGIAMLAVVAYCAYSIRSRRRAPEALA